MDPLEERIHERLESVLFSKEVIRQRVVAMGAEIQADYEGKPLTVVAILHGGALFMADLIREIHLPLRVDAVSVASYEGTVSTGTVSFHQTKLPDIDGRHVLLLDDILDTGRTLAAIRRKLETECSPLSIKEAVLLSKQIKRVEDVDAKYVGFEVGDEFVVGYGLDYNGEYRNIPMIGVLKDKYIG